MSTAPDNTITVVLTLKNAGSADGAEVPQVYLGVNDKDEPPLRLVGWSKIDLNAGESQQVRITISPPAKYMECGRKQLEVHSEQPRLCGLILARYPAQNKMKTISSKSNGAAKVTSAAPTEGVL
ncbi:MAG TPA: fibronectin type III-like domain-contianing protein [Edaphobacter sp.]|nr:fibronectin type III-like domain-contianing protein [Edaphobacter sp.]